MPLYIPVLDGLRGLAALWVLVCHCMIWGGWYWWRMPSAKLAVDLFMVLSGYLMVHQWNARGQAVTGRASREFYLRRFFRIAPLYYVVLAIVFAIQVDYLAGFAVMREHNPEYWQGDTRYDPAGRHLGFDNFLLHVSFLFGLLPAYSSSTFLPDWSLSLEMQFYAAFPLLMLLWHRCGVVITVLICVGVSQAVAAVLPEFPEPSPLPLKLGVFFVGMLTAEGVRVFADSPRRSAAYMLLAVLLAPLETRIIAGASALIFFNGISSESSRFRRISDVLFGNRLARFLADTSYAVYLIHGLFLSLAGGGWLFQQDSFLALAPRHRVAVLFAVTLVGSYSVGWLLHITVERAGIRAGKLIGRGQRNAVAHSPANVIAAEGTPSN